MLALFAAVVLGLVVAHTATTSLVARIWPRAETARQRITAFGFAFPVAAAVAGFLGLHLVYPGLPTTKAVELVHDSWTRILSADESPDLVLAGGGLGDPVLPEGDTLRFTPDSASVRGRVVSRWTVAAQTQTVLRIDGTAVNTDGAPALNPGESIVVTWRDRSCVPSTAGAPSRTHILNGFCWASTTARTESASGWSWSRRTAASTRPGGRSGLVGRSWTTRSGR